MSRLIYKKGKATQMKNLQIRQCAKEKGVFLYEIAESLGVSEATICRKLRRELQENEKDQFLKRIEEVSTRKSLEKPVFLNQK